MISTDKIISKIDAAIRFFLYVLVFWIPVSNAAVESCVITAVVLWLVKRGFLINRAARERRLNWLRFFEILRPAETVLDLPIAVFIFVCLLSCLFSAQPAESLSAFFTKTMEWFVVFYLFVEVMTQKKHYRIVLGIFLVASAGTALDSLIQYYFTGSDLFRGREITRGGACAAFNHANSLGTYWITALPLMLALGMAGFRKRISYWAVMTLMVWSLMITYSRAAWLALVGGLMVFLYLARRKKIFMILVILLAVFLLVVAVTPDAVLQKFRLDRSAFYNALSWRQGLWEDSLLMIRERPWLGHGINTFMRLFQGYRRKAFEHMPGYVPQPYSPTYAHNCYLQMAAEIGVLGLLSFLWILFRFYRISIRMIRNGFINQSQNVIIFIGLFAGITAYLIHSFFDTNLYSLRLSVYFWMVCGLALGYGRLHNFQLVKDKAGRNA